MQYAFPRALKRELLRFEGWQRRAESQERDEMESLGAGDRAGGAVSPAHRTYTYSSNVPLPIQLV